MYGRKVRETALALLRHNMVHFVSSDAHTCRGRAPRLQKARDLVAVTMGENMADNIKCLSNEIMPDLDVLLFYT